MTRRRPTETHPRPGTTGARALLAAALAVLVTLPPRAAAEPRPVDARVVWARAGHAYVAAPDSIALAPGDLLTLVRGRKTVAAGEVVQVLARDLVAARITSGSLERARLDKLRVLAERPPLRALSLLRIGCPGRGRANLLFECARPHPRPPLLGPAYRADSLGEDSYRFVREDGAGGGGASAGIQPDTILVRLYGEAADEEIALERGELDVAMFWPGEASSRLRADPRWQGFAYGTRGVLVADAPASGPPPSTLTPDLAPLAALNERLFRGDLAPWRGASGAMSRATSAPSLPPSGLRFLVDPSCPGRAMLERFLARADTTRDARGDAPAVRLRYLEAPASPSDSARAIPLFVVRCALVHEPGLRAHVSALGADAITSMLDCGTGTRAP